MKGCFFRTRWWGLGEMEMGRCGFYVLEVYGGRGDVYEGNGYLFTTKCHKDFHVQSTEPKPNPHPPKQPQR